MTRAGGRSRSTKGDLTRPELDTVRPPMRCIAMLPWGVVLCAWLGCRPSPTTASAADLVPQPGEVEAPAVGTSSDDRGGGATEAGCASWGGRLWEGRAAGCLYEVSGCCYDTPAQACAAAGCEEDGCRVMEVIPAQIRCDEVTGTARS
jgi:hypothetical protein